MLLHLTIVFVVLLCLHPSGSLAQPPLPPCSQDGKISGYIYDARYFLQCSVVTNIKLACPTGLYFNPRLAVCDFPFNSDVVGDVGIVSFTASSISNNGLTFTLKAGGNVAGGATIKISVSNRYTFVSGNGCFFTDISDVYVTCYIATTKASGTPPPGKYTAFGTATFVLRSPAIVNLRTTVTASLIASLLVDVNLIAGGTKGPDTQRTLTCTTVAGVNLCS